MDTTPTPSAEMNHLHARGFRHRAEVARSTECACFYCRERFSPNEIREWVDKNETALCPRCGIDSVIGDGGKVEGRVTDETLAEMRVVYFDTPAPGSLKEMELMELTARVSAMSPEEVAEAEAKVRAALDAHRPARRPS